MKQPERRVDGSLLVSIALHIVVGAALCCHPVDSESDQAVARSFERGEKPTVERITLRRGAVGGSAAATQRRRQRAGARQDALAPARRADDDPDHRSARAGEHRAAVRERPGRRRWRTAARESRRRTAIRACGRPRVRSYYAPKTQAERLDSAITTTRRSRTTIRCAATTAGKQPGDWTFEKNGQKYGMDSRRSTSASSRCRRRCSRCCRSTCRAIRRAIRTIG